MSHSDKEPEVPDDEPEKPGNEPENTRPVSPDEARRLGQDGGSNNSITPVDPKLPQFIGRYRVLAFLGEGGFGLVYRAADSQLQRDVAVKVMLREDIDASSRAKFFEEARIVAKLDHPNIVPVFDVGQTQEGDVYIVSKLIEGSNLKERIERERLDRTLSLQIIQQMADALHYAHSKGLIHRDIKPANILLDRSDKPFLTDFGLALRESEDRVEGQVAGTPAYMSPEQASGLGSRVNQCSDIYSLGVVLFELLTGRRPFAAENKESLIRAIKKRDVPSPRLFEESISPDLERICLKALARRASDRFTVARDFANELRGLIEQQKGTPNPQASAGESANKSGSQQQPSTVTSTPRSADLTPQDSDSGKTLPPRVVPKGLRSFDASDAGFFLELLPGPWDRDGLPEALRFWKTRIEETDADKTFQVGLIYGPSGCGKSSLMKAGLLPRLGPKILSVYIEAASSETETRLLRGVRKAIPDTEGGSLKEVLNTIRRRQLVPTGGKLLLVIDQFEQWLFAETNYAESSLTDALLECDGAIVQAIVMVREDFWVSVSRFLAELDIPIVERGNSAMVDLFSLEHATKVLGLFGKAYEKLPENAGQWTLDQHEFIRQAITGLSQDRKVISVRIAVLADMMKNRDWSTSALREVGGIEGVGVTFLEEMFGSRHAPIAHRKHQEAVQGALAALLPASGTDIKGSMQSSEALQEAAGYRDKPKQFEELLGILDKNLRLITPVDEDRAEESTAPQSYQLAHDYMVKPLRQWLTQKQRETKKGRAELKLAERADVWTVSQENKQLPSLVEWFQIRYWTDKKRWTAREQSLMRRASRVHSRNWSSAILGILALGGIIGYLFQQQSLRSQREKITQALDLLQEANGSAVPVNIEKLLEMKRPDLIQPDLASRFTAASEPREKLSLAFALANFGQVEADYLISQLDDIEDRDTANLIDALGHDATGSIDKLRQAANECSTLEFQRRKARLALVALALGDTTIPIDACEFEGRPDPGVRTWFIDEFRRWELNRQELAAIVKVSTSPALRSAVCLGLGQIPVKQVSTDDKNRIAELATQWYSLPDSSTHSAVAWLMREWEIPEPTLPDAKQMVDGRNWFVNSQGVTFVRITPKSEEYYSLPDPIEKFRRQFEKLTYLTDADLSGTPKKRLERAYAAYVLEKFDKALADFERLIENNFDLPKTLMYRTLVLARMKKTDEAKKALATWIDKHTKQQSPVSWNFDSWIRVRENTMLTDQGSKEGNRCLKFVAEKQAPDDITFFQKVAVKQNTWYLLSGWIKTENVVVEQTAGMVGANLSLASARWNGLTSDSVLGSSEWTYKTLVFNSKNDDSITVAARLGFNNSTVSGTAWFDDMCLIELPEQTVVNDLNLQKPSFLTAELRKANLIDNPGFEDFTTVPTKADSYHGYLESLVSLWLEDTEGANVALEKALQEVNQLDRDNLFFLACTLARFSEVERLGTERRQASINQSIRLLERWSTGSDADRVSMREHPDLLVLHPIFDFQRLTALRKPTPEHPYWLASREVTRGEYEAFLDDSSYDGEKPRDANVARPDDSVNPTPDHPAQKVSWYDAVMYCNWLSRQEGRTPAYRYAGKEKTKVNNDQEVEVDKWEEVDGVTGYRLPREVEWEYACRAGSETDWSTGSDISLLAVYCEMQSSQASTCGKKLPHAWGMHDMHGNVWEWCWDQFEGSSRVHRGGSWIDVATLCRTANRHWYVPASRTHVIGFRIALSSPSGIPK